MNKSDKLMSLMMGIYLVFMGGTLYLSYRVYSMVKAQQTPVNVQQREPLKIQVEYKLPSLGK